MASEKRFGYEWDKYSWMDQNYELQFQKWIGPLKPEDFKDKKVLDAGCGMGRNAYWALKYGAKNLTGFDYDERSIKAAKRNLSSFRNQKIEFRSIYELPWENEFDIAFSIGVIHHLENPSLAVRNMVKSVRPGGLVLIWVYGYNEWITKFINPIRKNITSKLPVSMVHLLSYPISVPLWAWVKIFKGPTPYLSQLSKFKFWHIHSIVFDQLIPTVANYWKEEEVRQLFDEMEEINVYPVNGNSWTVVAKKK